jgi:hypothetical protein
LAWDSSATWLTPDSSMLGSGNYLSFLGDAILEWAEEHSHPAEHEDVIRSFFKHHVRVVALLERLNLMTYLAVVLASRRTASRAKCASAAYGNRNRSCRLVGMAAGDQ